MKKPFFLMILNYWILKIPMENLKKKMQEAQIELALIISERVNQCLSEAHRDLFSQIFVMKEDMTVDNVAKIISDMPVLPEGIFTPGEGALFLVGELNAMFKLKGLLPEVVQKFTDKNEMKKQVSPFVRVPQYRLFDQSDYQQFLKDRKAYVSQIESCLRYPIIAKPVNGAGSLAVDYIADTQALLQWIEKCYADKNGFEGNFLYDWLYQQSNGNIVFELDEFISGNLYHCDSIVQNHQIIYTEACEYACSVMEVLNGKAIGSILLLDTDPLKKRMLAFNQSVLTALKLENGVTHMELFHTPNDELVFLEIAVRVPGSYIPQMYFAHDGINFEEIHACLSMNLPVKLHPVHQVYTAWLHYPVKLGKVNALNDIHAVKGITSQLKIDIKVKPGDVFTGNVQSIKDISAMLLLSNDNYPQLYQDWKKLQDFQVYS